MMCMCLCVSAGTCVVTTFGSWFSPAVFEAGSCLSLSSVHFSFLAILLFLFLILMQESGFSDVCYCIWLLMWSWELKLHSKLFELLSCLLVLF